MSFGWALSPMERDALWLSLKVASTATLVALPLGVGAAWLLARGRFPGLGVLSALLHLPLVLPPVVTGYALLVLFGHNGPIGRALEKIGIFFAFNWTGAALAAGIMGFPLMVRAMRLSFEAIDPGLEEAASSLGRAPLHRFLTVSLPLALPGVIAGAVLAFAKAMGEFGATITFVSNIPGVTQTLPSALYSLTQAPDGEAPALRLVILSVVVSLGALLLAERLSRAAARKVGGL